MSRELYLWEEVEVDGERGIVIEVHMSVPMQYLVKFPNRVYSTGHVLTKWYERPRITLLTESSG